MTSSQEQHNLSNLSENRSEKQAEKNIENQGHTNDETNNSTEEEFYDTVDTFMNDTISVDNEESTAKGDNNTINNVSVNPTEGDGIKTSK